MPIVLPTCAGGLAGLAQDTPLHTITIVVPYRAGGSIDLVACEAGNRLSSALGQSVVIENIGGASGNIDATQSSVKSLPSH